MKIIYWTCTALIAFLLLLSAYSYLFHTSTIGGIKKLGFPNYFRLQLAVLKIIAAVVLILPHFPLQVKEWAYAGIALFLLTAIVAHTANKDPVAISIVNVFFFLLVVASNVSLHQLI